MYCCPAKRNTHRNDKSTYVIHLDECPNDQESIGAIFSLWPFLLPWLRLDFPPTGAIESGLIAESPLLNPVASEICSMEIVPIEIRLTAVFYPRAASAAIWPARLVTNVFRLVKSLISLNSPVSFLSSHDCPLLFRQPIKFERGGVARFGITHFSRGDKLGLHSIRDVVPCRYTDSSKVLSLKSQIPAAHFCGIDRHEQPRDS